MSARSPSNAQTRFAASHSSALVELRFNLTPITETVCFTSEGEKDSATQRILSLITRFRETLGKIDTVPSRTIDRTIDSHASIYFGTPEDRRHPLTGNTDELATAYELFLEALLSDVQRENPDSSAAPEPYNPEDLSTYAQKYPRARHVIRHLRVTISGEDDPEHEAFVQSFASTPDAIYVAANTATAREIYTQLRSSDRASNFLTFAALFDGRNTQAGARYVTTRRTYLHALTLPNPKIDFTAPTFFERAEDFIDFNVSGLVTDVLLASPAQDVFIHSTRDGLPYLEALSVLTDDKLTISDTSPGRQPIYALEAAPYNALHICFCETDLIREYGRLCQAFNEHKLAAEPRLLPDNIPDDLAAEIMTEYKNGKAIVVATPAIAYQPNISADIILFREPGTLGPDNPVVTAQVRNLVERARPQYILTLTSEESLKVESALSTQNQIDTAKNRPRLPITPPAEILFPKNTAQKETSIFKNVREAALHQQAVFDPILPETDAFATREPIGIAEKASIPSLCYAEALREQIYTPLPPAQIVYASTDHFSGPTPPRFYQNCIFFEYGIDFQIDATRNELFTFGTTSAPRQTNASTMTDFCLAIRERRVFAWHSLRNPKAFPHDIVKKHAEEILELTHSLKTLLTSSALRHRAINAYEDDNIPF